MDTPCKNCLNTNVPIISFRIVDRSHFTPSQIQMTRSVFLSVVNTEFEEVRKLRKHWLECAGYKVYDQPTFPHTATATINKLSELVRKSDLVIQLIGKASGSLPSDVCRELFFSAENNATNFLCDLPNLRTALGDCSDLSYTQWEAFLALHHRRPLIVYTNIDPADPQHPQRLHLERLKLADKYADLFNEDDLGERVQTHVNYHFFGSDSAQKAKLDHGKPSDICIDDSPKHRSPSTWFTN